MNAEKLMKTIRGVRAGKYGCRSTELNMILDHNRNSPAGSAVDAFQYGFLKGQRAAKAEAKRKQRLILDKDKTGWYGLICRCARRNIGNEIFLSRLGSYARSLEAAMNKKEGEQNA